MSDFPTRTKFATLPPEPFVASTREPEPAPDGAGPCGFCALSSARSWWPTPMRWADGAPVLLCGQCRRAWRAAGEPGPRSIDRVRAAAYRAATGLSWLGMADSDDVQAFRAYFEVPGADREGRAEPWTYARALVELRDEVFTQWPWRAPEELRDEYQRRHDALRAQEKAERAAKAAAAQEAEKAAQEAAQAAWLVA